MSVDKITKDIFNSTKDMIIKAINEGFEDNRLNIVVWFTVVSTLMINVEKYNRLSGSTKRMIVVRVCKLGVEHSKLKDDEKLLINTLIDSTLPPLIDQAAFMANNVNIKGKIGKIFKKLTHCICGNIDVVEDEPAPQPQLPEPVTEEEPIVEEEKQPEPVEEEKQPEPEQ